MSCIYEKKRCFFSGVGAGGGRGVGCSLTLLTFAYLSGAAVGAFPGGLVWVFSLLLFHVQNSA